MWPIVQCGFLCLDYGIYSAIEGGEVAGNVAYVFTFSVSPLCVNLNPSDQAQVSAQLRGQSFQSSVKIFS